MAAGGPTELHVYPGTCHGAETYAPVAAVARRIWTTRLTAMHRAWV